MAFGGAPVNAVAAPAGQGGPVNVLQVTGLTLTVFVAAPPVIANADTGQLTTGTPVANQTQLLPAFAGKGAGGWLAGDENLVSVLIQDLGDAVQGVAGQIPVAHLVSVAVVAANLVVTIHNKGLQALAAARLTIRYNHSLIR